LPAARNPVLLWVDTFTNHFVPQVDIAAVAVLESAGFRVAIPERRRSAQRAPGRTFRQYLIKGD
jgi:Fe-S oxidoreductase